MYIMEKNPSQQQYTKETKNLQRKNLKYMVFVPG